MFPVSELSMDWIWTVEMLEILEILFHSVWVHIHICAYVHMLDGPTPWTFLYSSSIELQTVTPTASTCLSSLDMGILCLYCL